MSPVVKPGVLNSVADVIELAVPIPCSSFLSDLVSEGAVVESTVEYIMSPVVMPEDTNAVADVTELVVAISCSSFLTDVVSEGAVVE